MVIREVGSAGDVIDVLGGTFVVARRYRKTPQAISNWRARGIPTDFAIVADITAELKKRQLKPAPAVWSRRTASARPRRKRAA